jgi:hypothetical protein
MGTFQLDISDCDAILSIVDRECIPVYLVHIQIIGRILPPTERLQGVGFWWTDLWAMQSSFLVREIGLARIGPLHTMEPKCSETLLR